MIRITLFQTDKVSRILAKNEPGTSDLISRRIQEIDDASLKKSRTNDEE
jgi:hypothetical protein